MNKITAKPNSVATSLPCLASLGHSTEDKRLRYASPKLPSATSFIPNTLSEIVSLKTNKKLKNWWCFIIS